MPAKKSTKKTAKKPAKKGGTKPAVVPPGIPLGCIDGAIAQFMTCLKNGVNPGLCSKRLMKNLEACFRK